MKSMSLRFEQEESVYKKDKSTKQQAMAQSIAKSLELIKKEEEAAEDKQAKAEAKEKEKVTAVVTPNPLPVAPTAPPPTQSTEPTTQEAIHTETAESQEYRAKIQFIRSTILPAVTNNPQWREFCSDAKRVITPKIGQLTNKKQTIIRITREVDTILQKSKHVSQQAYFWLLNHTAKATVKQAEAEVTVKPESSFPLARVCISLMNHHPDFKLILLARMYKNCPFILPIYLQKSPQQSTDEYLKWIGYIKPDGESWESEAAYVERMNGIVALYAALLQTTPDNPLSFSGAWIWLARQCNAQPRMETASLINTFLEIIGNELLVRYGQQAIKLIKFIKYDYLARVPTTNVSAATRLDNYLDRCMKNGRVEQVQGRDWVE